MPEKFRLYRRAFKGRDGESRRTENFYIDFRDHLRTRHRWPLERSEGVCQEIGRRLVRLVEFRQLGDAPPPEYFKWLDTLPQHLVERIAAANLIDAGHSARSDSLENHLEGKRDDKGKLLAPGYRQ